MAALFPVKQRVVQEGATGRRFFGEEKTCLDRGCKVSRETARPRRMPLNNASTGWRITCAATPGPIK
jgi:hypothetical protein